MAATPDLLRVNLDIGRMEESGDVESLGALLAPVFAMRRARDHDTFADREGFLVDIKGGARKTSDVSVLFESDRCAVVTCVVHVPSATEPDKQYRNVRLFIRQTPSEAWSLLAWANELVIGDEP